MRKCNGHGPGGTVRCLQCVEPVDQGVLNIPLGAASTELANNGDPYACSDAVVIPVDRTPAGYRPRGE